MRKILSIVLYLLAGICGFFVLLAIVYISDEGSSTVLVTFGILGMILWYAGSSVSHPQSKQYTKPAEPVTTKPVTTEVQAPTTTARAEPKHVVVKSPRLFGQSTHIAGDIEYMVYTYDGTPLRSLRKGTIFEAQVRFHGVHLRSTLTGTTWSSMDGGAALAYQGKPFGFFPNEQLVKYIRKRMAEDGASKAFVQVKHTGWYAQGIPEIKILAPSTRWSKDNSIRELAGLPDQSDMSTLDSVSFSLSKNTPPIEYLLNGRMEATVTVTLSLIPTPQGSSAKPHVALTVVGSTTPLVDISARSGSYYDLAAHNGKTAKMRIVKAETMFDHDDDGFYYSISLVFY